MTTHPTTAHTSAPTCLRCARLERELSRLTGRLDLLTWAVRRLCERLDDPRLAAFLADTADTADTADAAAADDGEEPA